MLEAEIRVTLKKIVSDPQGLTIKHGLESLGYNEVKEARIGKFIVLKLDLKDKRLAEKMLKEMCKKLLANPIIEEYSFTIEESKE